MNTNYETFGTLAIEPYQEEPQGSVIPFNWFRDAGSAEKSDVERMLDDFDGSLTADSRSDRRFLGVAIAIAVIAVFFFSFAPIF